MVKITLEYGSVEEAIQALGKLSGLAKVRRAAQSTTGTAPSAPSTEAAGIPQGPVTAAAPTKRKGRSDKGKPRGPQQKSEGAGAGAQPGISASAAEPYAAPAPEASAQKAAASPSEADAKAALEAYFEKNGPQAAMKLLADHGVSRLRDLPEGDRAKFIEACK